MRKTKKTTGAASIITEPLRKKNANATKANPASSTKKLAASKLTRTKKRHGAMQMGGAHDWQRYSIVWGIILLCFFVLFARAFYLQVLNADYYIEKGDSLITVKQSPVVYRGMIVDTLGMPLAANAPLSIIAFSPYDYAQKYYHLKKILADNSIQKGDRKKQLSAKQIKERDRAIQELDDMQLVKLAALTNFPLERLQKAVKIDDTIDVTDEDAVKNALPTGAGSRHLVLLNKVSPEVAAPVLAADFVGVTESKFFQRYYLQAEPNAQILGYMAQSSGDDGGYVGRAGIESKYEKRLAGERGQYLMLRDARRSAIKELKQIKPEVPAQDVHLTIDSRLQYVLYKELEKVGREQSARSSSGMVVDVATGDVLAMSTWPSFNSNNLSERTGANERNRPVLDVFEPGSVMKPFTVAAALESGKYTTSTLIDTSPGSIRIGGYSIRDAGNYGQITLAKLIQKSSNVAPAKIALSLPNDAIANMQRKFGLGQKTALQFPAEATGKVTVPDEKDSSRRATMAYGYGQQITLAQLAQAYAVLGNNGKMQPLRLVKDEPMVEPTQIISPRHAQEVVGMMELVTQAGGTARSAAINGYRVAGKTGTTRRNNPNGGYYNDQHRTVFAGIAPASNPRFVTVIWVEDPRENFYAGKVAAPVFHNVMKEALRIYNVPFDKPLTEHQ
ncbi:penicillin-binding protein 2 [Moraxella nasovis]|uniref:peptidoglycan D,D-transpeptidase FtsI family protein n=1 Tax=Moraxella nasovis TaxID=2904121 RepID=UPI001F603126|nr:penicillin-binding protein 2 [Moraxella nasovis]UNU74307.1 penicillin-binding protein 2 [Moraxella nasovis]